MHQTIKKQVRSAAAENERLKQDLASSLDELDCASQGFHALKERNVTLEVELESATSRNHALLQQLGGETAEFIMH